MNIKQTKMKKIILTVVIALLVGISANAQFYIGGSLSFSHSSSKIEEVENSSQPFYTFSISPEIGYQLNEKTAVGLSLSSHLSSSENQPIISNIIFGIQETKRTDFGIAPYIRYSFLKWKKFDLLGMANVYINKGTTTIATELDYPFGNGFDSKNKTKTTTWGAMIQPVLCYNVSDKLILLSHLNFFRLGFSYEKTKMSNFAGGEYTGKTTQFGLDLDTYNALPSIGFIYKL